MTLSARQRWLAYAAAALLTLAAMRWVDSRDDTSSVALPVLRSAPATPARPGADNRAGPADAIGRLDSVSTRTIAAPVSDPFEATGAGSAQALAATAAAAAAASRPERTGAAGPAQPGLPPLPFSFLGRWTERGQTTVYLQRDNRSISVQAPGRLDDEYSVESIDDQGIVLHYLPLGRLQTLRFEARPADAAAPRPQPVTAAADTPAPDEGDN